MKLNDFKIASDSFKKRYYYHMAVSCKDWSNQIYGMRL